jgi:hypothetical protein
MPDAAIAHRRRPSTNAQRAIIAGVLASSVMAASCVPCGQAARLILIFIDASASVSFADAARYSQNLRRELQRARLQPGDRVVVATIGGATLVKFNPLADVELPRTGRPGRDRFASAAACQRLLAMLEQPVAREDRKEPTRALDALKVAELVFEADGVRKRRTVIICSDAQEDSRRYHFGRMTLDAAACRRIIEADRAAGLLAQLGGAQVHVIGATAAGPQEWVQLEAFWRAYIAASGGVCPPGGFQRDGLRIDWEPGRDT